MFTRKKTNSGANNQAANPFRVKTNLKPGLSKIFEKWFHKDENGLWRLSFGRDANLLDN